MGTAIDFVILFFLYITIFYRKWCAKGRDILLVNSTMYLYLSFVLYFTLMPVTTALPFVFSHPYTPMNLIPFIDFIDGRGDFVRQIMLNILMTIPFGFLSPLIQRRDSKLIKTILYCFLLSLSIELLQPLISGFRSSDITDILTNVLGSLVGYVLYLLLKPITVKMLSRIKSV